MALLNLGDTAFAVMRPTDKQKTDDSMSRDYTMAAASDRCQAVAFTFGKRQVIVFAEAAALTVQMSPSGLRLGMNYASIYSRRPALKIMHWLSGLLKIIELQTRSRRSKILTITILSKYLSARRFSHKGMY
ncbi:MAG TPA: hypothetical protein VNN73_02925 [Blastocatellia bacterium]|nr:hypothetical protein [Blastocatellia bacterium]